MSTAISSVLITGFGFIGRHAARELRRRGCQVSVLGRKLDLADAASFGVDPIVGDIRDADLLSNLVPEFDGVLNLAALLGTSEMVDNPVPAIGTNITGAVNVFQACRRAAALGRPVRCVQITAASYFMDNTYAITKDTADRFARMFNAEHGTDIRILRALNTYGEYQRNHPARKVVPSFIRAALEDQPLQIYGTGEQVMDVIYAGDVARALAGVLFADPPPPLVSAGTGRPMTVNRIAEVVVQAVGSRSPIVHQPMRAGEPQHSVILGEPETLRGIGMDPETLVPFEEGVHTAVRWYRANRDFLG
jgi:nucleoside-diphosphate-sugar epimerase